MRHLRGEFLLDKRSKNYYLTKIYMRYIVGNNVS